MKSSLRPKTRISIIRTTMSLSYMEQHTEIFSPSYSKELSGIRNDSLIYLALFSVFLDSLSEKRQTSLKNE